MFFKTFRWSFAITLIALVLAFLYGGIGDLILVSILILIEVTLSLDNAIINTRVLKQIAKGPKGEYWVKMFLTVGILVAVVGVRFLLPVLLVSGTTGINPISVIDLAFQNGDPHVEGTYGYFVLAAHPQLASVAGVFLLLLFFNWLFEDKEHPWIKWIETPLGKFQGGAGAPVILTLAVLLIFALINPEHAQDIFTAGIIGIIASLAIDTLSELFGGGDGTTKVVKTGFAGFLYIEGIDASLSLDSLGAGLAVTSSIVLLILGLGVGAIYVRSMTIYLMKAGSLNTYRYLESGAMWAIGALAFILFFSIKTEISEFVVGGIGMSFVISAFYGSILANKKDKKQGVEVEKMTVED